MDPRTRTRWVWALAVAGLAVRWGVIHATRAQEPHPDFGSFAGPASLMTHPYDTSFREPAFVWWLWLLARLGVAAHPWVRAITALWFAPTLFMAEEVARLAGCDGSSLAVAALYAFLPAQVHADTLALRHGMEAFGAALLAVPLLRSPGLRGRGPWIRAAAATALLSLTRINLLASSVLLLAWAGLRARSLRPLAAALPAALLLLPHFCNNQRRFGDPFYSVNHHAYWFENLENIGKPGGPPTVEQWRKDPFHESRNFLDWRFRNRPAFSLLRDLAVGVPRSLTIFYRKVYFAEHLPAPATWLFMGLYLLGFAAALGDRTARFLPAALAAFCLPYALIIHAFWAGRFFVPFTPLVLTLVVRGAELPARWARPAGGPG